MAVMSPKRPAPQIFLLIQTLLLISGSLWAQDVDAPLEAPAEPDTRDIEVLVFPAWNLDGEPMDGENGGENADSALDAESKEYRRIIDDIVVNEVIGRGFTAVPSDSWAGYMQRSGRDDVFTRLPVDIAAADDRDVALSVYFRLEERRVFLMVKAYDIRSDRIIAGDVRIARSGLLLLTSMKELMTEIMDQIGDAAGQILFMKQNPGILVGTSAATVDFASTDEGTVLSMPGFGVIGRIENGNARLPYQPLALGQQLEVEKSLDGYYSATQAFALTGRTNQVTLSPLYPKSSFATEFAYNPWFFLGLQSALRMYLLSDTMYLRLANQFYFNLPRDDLPEGGRTLVHDEVSLEYGNYLFFPPESRYRLAYAAGFGLAFSPVSTGATAVDSYINLIVLHHELNYPHFAFFLRQELRYNLPLFSPRIWSNGLGMTPELVPLTLGVMVKW